MTQRQLVPLVAVCVVVLLLGVLIGTRITTSRGTAAPATVLPTIAPTAMPTPTPAAPPLLRGLGTRYYESDNGDDGRVELQYVGSQVVAHVIYGLSLGANPIYTGTVAGTTLIAKAPSLPALHNPHTEDTLIVHVTQPGEARVTLRYPKNDVGIATADVTFSAICGSKADAFRGQSCQALTKP